MGTDKPKVQGYIQPKLYERFEEWKRDRGVTKDSQALNQLFSEFFGLAYDTPSFSDREHLEEIVTRLVQERTEYILNSVNGIVGEVRSNVVSLSEQLEALTQAVNAMQSADGLSSRLPSGLLSRLPVQDAIAADVQTQAIGDSSVNHSKLPTASLSKTLSS